MPRTIFLHAGKHKTGSTSIQHYLADNAEYLANLGLATVENLFEVVPKRRATALVNCFDIAHCIIRPELNTPIRLRYPELAAPTLEQQRLQALRINERLMAKPGHALIISAEAFSFLRRPSEREIFDLVFQGFEVRTVLFLRERQDWLESWKKQTAGALAKFGRPVGDVESVLDYELSSWLADDASIEAFFQPGCQTLCYEAAMEKHGSVVPAFLEAIGLDPSECPPWQEYWRNRS